MARQCDGCGRKMTPFVPRKKNGSGDMLCEGCSNGREGRPLTRSADVNDEYVQSVKDMTDAEFDEFMCSLKGHGVEQGRIDNMYETRRTSQLIRAQAHQTPDSSGYLVKVAHGNMDGVTVFHCLEGETRYWSHDGIRTLKETAGTTQKVLTSSGKWVDAHIHAFGEQSLMKVTLRRNKREKVIFATPEHRWIVRTGTTHHEGTTTTENLKPEHRLASRVPKSRIGQTVPSQFGIAHGFIYGDGTRAAGSTSVNLWGEKDAQMLKYFNESIMSPRKTDNGVLGSHISCLPAFFKDHPSLDEATSYLYGWMAGYFAADGTVSKSGQVILHSARQADLEFVQLVGMRLGIATYDIIAKERQGYGDEPSTLYSMQFVGSTLNSNFFLTKTHRERFDAAQAKDTFDRIGWTVVSVENTDRFEEVFCAVVPGTESFVLDGLILTGNCPFCGSGQVVNSGTSIECGFCHSAFTVLVQPQFPMMPQTVDGQPYTPGEQPGNNPTTPAAAPGEDPDDEGSFGGDELSEKLPTDDATDDAAAGDDSGNPFAKKDDSDKPPAPKESSLTGAYITEEGVVLSESEFMAHLAIKFSPNRTETLAEVKRLHGTV